MTDQIDLNDTPPPRRKPKALSIVIIAILALLAFTGYTLYQRFQMFANMGPPDMGPAGVIVTEVRSYQFADKIEATIRAPWCIS